MLMEVMCLRLRRRSRGFWWEIIRMDTESYVKAQRMADALASMLRNAGGTMTAVAHSKEEYARYIEGITDVMSCLGIDTSKDFWSME